MHRIYLIVVLLWSQYSYACRELDWSPSEWAENSNAVYIGKIVRISSVQEAARPKPDPTAAAIDANMKDRALSIRVIETLKGKPMENLDINISWCGGGSGSVADEVVTFQLGKKWHIKSSGAAITETKAALTNHSKATPQRGSL